MFAYQMPSNSELWRAEWQPGSYPQKQIVKKSSAVVKEQGILILMLFFLV